MTTKDAYDRHIAARALRSAAADIAASFPLNGELRHDGTVDPLASAYVEGMHDAWAIVRDRADALHEDGAA
jgi:hypothetical protein